MCDEHLLPLVPGLEAEDALAVLHVLETIHRTTEALEQIAMPCDRESQTVSRQVERMYVGLQCQDRISQMMALLLGDMQRLQALRADPGTNPDAMSHETWLHSSNHATRWPRNARPTRAVRLIRCRTMTKPIFSERLVRWRKRFS